ncbi:hypothetical protein BOTBODRAFT_131276 [Botryobasidium botryosum FD-172 SS1]|uniref:Lactonase n=1 Tax=Botryobasidium botryosum (strain FD-172 SS1) TaxID=930990 RepID=A0A067MI57_BOTB1|nr:hypothetical protein BOTBODRAFT_131276 [Botryobasidium botryosum FD-172 SS1]
MSSFKILVGSYTAAITALNFVTNPASLNVLSTSNVGQSPSWIASHPSNSSILFSTFENSYGEVGSFTVDSQGRLTKAASVYSGGQNPAHLAVLSSGKEIYVTNYNSGTAESIPLLSDNLRFGNPGAVTTFTGSGPNKDRQTSSHPHEVIEGSGELFVPDLGSDKVWRLVKDGSTNNYRNVGSIQQAAGSGPRHGVVKDGQLYILHELDNKLTQQTIPPVGSSAAPVTVASLSILPPNAPSGLGAGELLLSRPLSSGAQQYLYATNRGDPSGDSIAIFSLNPLKLVKQFKTNLNHIRGLALGGPNDQYLVAGGLNGGGVAVYERINGGADFRLVAQNYGVSQPTGFVVI